jgi:hypothetical protein
VTTGISISGSKVNIPSFASAVPMLPNIAVPLGPRRAPAVTIIATSRSGGALNRYGVLKGGKIYTIYIPTSAGNVVLQFAARTRGRATFEEDLTAPEALFATVPPRLSRARYLVAAVLDTAGLLKDVQLLEGEVSTFSTVFITDLQKWRFRPVLRNGKPISVNAVLGFNVGTH